VNLPEPPSTPPSNRVPKSAFITMVVILAAMAFVSLFSHIQRWRRDQIETVIVTTPAASASPTPSP